jgi:hypothetical protein
LHGILASMRARHFVPAFASTRRPWTARWQVLVIWLTLLSVAWPSLGPLPYLVDPSSSPAAVPPHGHAAGEHDHHQVDLAALPGSPTHPLDHHCAECEVLKHLSRCLLPVFAIVLPTAVCAPIVAPRIGIPRRSAGLSARLPPVRAPPATIRLTHSLFAG